MPDPGGLGLVTDLSAAWIAGLLDATLKGTLLLVLAVLAARMLDGAPAAARHLVWAAALVGLLALPVIAPVTPGLEVPLLPRVELTSSAPPPAAAPVTTAPAVGAAAGPEAPPRDGVAPRRHGAAPPAPESASGADAATARRSTSAWLAQVDPRLLVGGVWLLGALLVLGTLLVGKARIRWLARDADRVRGGPWAELRDRIAERLGLERSVDLLLGPRPLVPMTWGVVRPRVMLPESADTWPDACRRNVLLHELAHVKRRDCLVRLVARLACAVYWFHPLVWHAVRRLRLEQEEACDDHVLRAGTLASDYARQLVGLARLLRAVRTPAHAGSTGVGRSDFMRRMRALLDGGRSRRPLRRRTAAILGSAAAVVVVGLAAVRPAGPELDAAADGEAVDVAAFGEGDRGTAVPDGAADGHIGLELAAVRVVPPAVERGPSGGRAPEAGPPAPEVGASGPDGSDAGEGAAAGRVPGAPAAGDGHREERDAAPAEAAGPLGEPAAASGPAVGVSERRGAAREPGADRGGVEALQAAFAPYWHAVDGEGDAAEGKGDAAEGKGDAAEGKGDAAEGKDDAADGGRGAAPGNEEAVAGESFGSVTVSARTLARELDALEDAAAREGLLRRNARPGSTRSLAVLMELSFLARRPGDRVTAVRTLAEAPGGARARFLYQVARANPWVEVRAAAAQQLRFLEPERVVPWLVTLVYEDASPAMQRRAVTELASLDREGVDTSLMQIARSHPEANVRLEAIIWLLRTGSGQALSKYVENA